MPIHGGMRKQLRNGTLWDDTTACKNAALGQEIGTQDSDRRDQTTQRGFERWGVLPKDLRRKLLVLSLLIGLFGGT